MIGIAVALALLGGVAFGWWGALAAALLVGAWVVAGDRTRQRAVVAIVVAGAGALGTVRAAPAPTVASPEWTENAEGFRGEVVSAPVWTGQAQHFVVAVGEVRVGGDWLGGTGRLCAATRPYPPIRLGDRVRLSGGAERIEHQSRAGRGFLRSRGCGASTYAFAATVEAPGSGWQRDLAGLRGRLAEVLRRAAPGDAGVLLGGLVTGDDRALSDRRQAAFIETGTSHITAISGANLALLVVLLTGAGQALRLGHAAAWRALVVGGVWGYALLAGLEPPALRAAIAATGVVAAAALGRRADALTLIAVAAAVMVVVRPDLLWSLSFQLSFAASLGLAAALSEPAAGFGPDWLLPALAATAVAQAATLPILLPVVGTFSLAGLPANLLIAPLVAVAFPIAALAAAVGVVWYPAGETIAQPARLAAEATIRLVDGLAALPWAVQPLGIPPLAATAVLVLGIGVGVALVGRDGRNLARRVPAEWRSAAVAPRMAVGGVAAGVVLGAALLALR